MCSSHIKNYTHVYSHKIVPSIQGVFKDREYTPCYFGCILGEDRREICFTWDSELTYVLKCKLFHFPLLRRSIFSKNDNNIFWSHILFQNFATVLPGKIISLPLELTRPVWLFQWEERNTGDIHNFQG